MNAATRDLAPSTLDGAPAFIGMCDASFRPTYLNPAGRSLVGFSDTMDLASVSVGDFFVREHREVVESVGLPTMAREGRWEQDLRFRHWQDPARAFDVACCIFGLYDEQKNFLAGVTITQEIRNRTQAERALRDGRAMVDAVLEQLPVEVGIFDARGRLLHSNDGWRRHGLVSLPVLTRTPPQRWKRYAKGGELLGPEDHGLRALNGQPFSGEELLRVTPGQPAHWFRVDASPLPGSAGTPLGAVVVMQDIDAMRSAGAKLARSEARLRVAAEVTGVGTFLFDPSTGAFDCDDRLRHLWGLGEGECVDWEAFQAGFHPDDASRVRAAIGSCMSATHPKAFAIEFRVVCREGGEARLVAGSFRSTFDGDRMALLVGACLDVTPAGNARSFEASHVV